MEKLSNLFFKILTEHRAVDERLRLDGLVASWLDDGGLFGRPDADGWLVNVTTRGNFVGPVARAFVVGVVPNATSNPSNHRALVRDVCVWEFS